MGRSRSAGKQASRSSSSDSSSSAASSKKKKKKKRRKRSSSSDSSSAANVSKHEDTVSTNPDIETAKAEALDQLQKINSIEPKDARVKEFRALLRRWHPDKNLDRAEVATAVFQFLQKGK